MTEEETKEWWEQRDQEAKHFDRNVQTVFRWAVAGDFNKMIEAMARLEDNELNILVFKSQDIARIGAEFQRKRRQKEADRQWEEGYESRMERIGHIRQIIQAQQSSGDEPGLTKRLFESASR